MFKLKKKRKKNTPSWLHPRQLLSPEARPAKSTYLINHTPSWLHPRQLLSPEARPAKTGCNLHGPFDGHFWP